MKILLAIALLALSCAAQPFGGFVSGSSSGGPGGNGAANYLLAINTTSTTWAVPASSHLNGHKALDVTCYTSAGAAMPYVASGPAAGQYSYTVNGSTFQVDITFGAGGNNGGWCAINGSGQGIPGPAGAPGATGPQGPAGSGTGDVIGPAGGVADGQMVVFDLTTGKLVKGGSGTGYPKMTAGVPAYNSTIPQADVNGLTTSLGTKLDKLSSASAASAVVQADGTVARATGTASNCMKVDGSNGPCGAGSGDMVGIASSTPNQSLKFAGTDGKTVAAVTDTGYPKLTAGVAAYASTIPQADVTGLPASLATKMDKLASGSVAVGIVQADGTVARASGSGCLQADGTTTTCSGSLAGGTGIVVSGGTINIDPVVVQGRNTITPTSSSTSTFTATMVPSVAAYSDMVAYFTPNFNCSSPTLNLYHAGSPLGAKNMYEADGTTAMTCTAGQRIQMWYDPAANGAVGGWRKLGAPPASGASWYFSTGNAPATVAQSGTAPSGQVAALTGSFAFTNAGAGARFSRIMKTGTLKNIGIILGQQMPNQPTTCKVQISSNGSTWSDSGLSVTIPADANPTGGAGLIYDDPTNTAAVTAGQYGRWLCLNSHATVTSGGIVGSFGEVQ